MILTPAEQNRPDRYRVNKVKKTITTLTLALAVALASVSMGLADINPTPYWMSFLGDVTYNGSNLLPLGSRIDAYDPDGVLCGTDYVENVLDSSGVYGSMAVYGDDVTWTPSVDEGAETGDLISFYINGRPAAAEVVSGSIYWQDKATSIVNLSANDFTFGMTLVDPPSNTSGDPGTTLRFQVGVQNNGNGLDFYTIEVTSANGWTVTVPDYYIYADPGQTAYVWFDVFLPPFTSNMYDELSYTVHSQTALPSASVSGSVTAIRDAEVEYAASITTAPANTYASPGEVVNVQVGVTNDGNVPDMYSIISESNLAWTTNDPLSFWPADPDEEVYVTFTVTVPYDAEQDDVSEITYYVASAYDPSLILQGSFTISVVATGIDDDPFGMLPTELSVGQNYPNPFNPTTTIVFSIPSRSSVSLSVIDILGRTVDMRDLGSLSTGSHEFEYDASALSSGVYFYRITTAESSQTRKMVLVK